MGQLALHDGRSPTGRRIQLSSRTTKIIGGGVLTSAACRSATNVTARSPGRLAIAPRFTALSASTGAYSGVWSSPGMIPTSYSRISTASALVPDVLREALQQSRVPHLALRAFELLSGPQRDVRTPRETQGRKFARDLRPTMCLLEYPMCSANFSCVHPRASRALRRRAPNAALGELSGSNSLRFKGLSPDLSFPSDTLNGSPPPVTLNLPVVESLRRGATVPDENVPVRSEPPPAISPNPPIPPVGTLVVDAQGRIGEFRGEWSARGPCAGSPAARIGRCPPRTYDP